MSVSGWKRIALYKHLNSRFSFYLYTVNCIIFLIPNSKIYICSLYFTLFYSIFVFQHKIFNISWMATKADAGLYSVNRISQLTERKLPDCFKSNKAGTTFWPLFPSSAQWTSVSITNEFIIYADYDLTFLVISNHFWLSVFVRKTAERFFFFLPN